VPSEPSLAERLLALRREANLTQSALGKALGVSVPLISSWEKGTVPPDHRLDAYAKVFAAGHGDRYEQLRSELRALQSRSPAQEAPHPLQFGPQESITIVCSKLPERKRLSFGNVDGDDADHIAAYKYADLDALIELLPAIMALNPTSPVVVGTADEMAHSDLTAHLITLGGVDWNPVTAALLRHLDHVPVRQLQRDSDHDAGGFLVEPDGTALSPRVVQTPRKTTLMEDVAHFLRAPNPYNRRRTLTIFNGSFSRGTCGIVQSLVDPRIRQRNAAHFARRAAGAGTYSIVCRVRIVADQVVIPDWTMADDRLHEWPATADPPTSD
jgi:transcriptional regulator with XRE-family HTH domain